MKKKSDYLTILRRYEILIASALVIVVVIVLSWNILIPNLFKSKEIYLQQKQISAQLDSLRKKSNALSKLDKDYYKETLVKLTQVLPIDKDFVSLFAAFDLLQSKTGALIINTQFQLENTSSGPSGVNQRETVSTKTIPMKLEIIGDETAILLFLDSVDDLAGRIMTIENTHLTLKEDGLVGAQLTAAAHFNPAPGRAASLETPLPTIGKTELETLEKIASSVVIIPPADPQEVSLGKEDLFN